MSERPTAVPLFAGVGGIDLALERILARRVAEAAAEGKRRGAVKARAEWDEWMRLEVTHLAVLGRIDA